MIKTAIYKCKACGAILLLQDSFLTRAKCNICGQPMKKLNEDFDLSEIIECDSCKNETGVIEEP